MKDLLIGSFFQLLWQPGLRLHEHWWIRLDLSHWEKNYPLLSPKGQRELDRLICHRRQFPLASNNLPLSNHSALQSALIRADRRMPVLLLALGLLLLECPDYLLWRPYREVLSSHLSHVQLEQLQILWRRGRRSPQLSPADLIQGAQMTGLTALSLELQNEPVWQAISYSLPVADDCLSASALTVSAEQIFMRLERFL
ncbi:hypothetical protein VL10_24105 [Leclercia adecarboxylata]|nr:hypothetical protein VL10_24105 [Leclercia adecarboxylata]KMN66759.1 hypothetical protein VK95_04545 [Leclercia sp. LK8]